METPKRERATALNNPPAVALHNVNKDDDHSTNILTITGRLYDKEIEIVLDTGSSLNIVEQSYAPQYEKSKPNSQIIITAGGNFV